MPQVSQYSNNCQFFFEPFSSVKHLNTKDNSPLVDNLTHASSILQVSGQFDNNLDSLRSKRLSTSLDHESVHTHMTKCVTCDFQCALHTSCSYNTRHLTQVRLTSVEYFLCLVMYCPVQLTTNVDKHSRTHTAFAQ